MVLTKRSELLNEIYESLCNYFEPLGGLCLNAYGFTKKDKKNLTSIMKSGFLKEGIDIFEYQNGIEKLQPVTIHLTNSHIEIIAKISELKEKLHIDLELLSSDCEKRYKNISIKGIESKIKEFYPKSKIKEKVRKVDEMLKKYKNILGDNSPPKSLPINTPL